MKAHFNIITKDGYPVALVHNYDFGQHKIHFSSEGMSVDGKELRDFFAPKFQEAGTPLPSDCTSFDFVGSHFDMSKITKDDDVNLNFYP